MSTGLEKVEFSRSGQMLAALAAVEQHNAIRHLLTTATRNHASQTSQLEGLYAEVDKLTKGKTMVPTSDLMVELVNSLIDDAKHAVFADVYLDRLKLFVPAGTNPEYPDVLVALRVLQQVLKRFGSLITLETNKCLSIGSEIHTILAALRVAEEDEISYQNQHSDELDEEADSEEDEDDDQDDDSSSLNEDDSDEDDIRPYEEYVTSEQVRSKLMAGAVSSAWFEADLSGDLLFNFERLDQLGIPQYVAPAEGTTFIGTIDDE